MDNQFTVNAALITAIITAASSIIVSLCHAFVEHTKSKMELKIRMKELALSSLSRSISTTISAYAELRKEETFDAYWRFLSSLYSIVPLIENYDMRLELHRFIDALRELSSIRPFSIPNEMDNRFFSLMSALSHSFNPC